MCFGTSLVWWEIVLMLNTSFVLASVIEIRLMDHRIAYRIAYLVIADADNSLITLIMD